MDKAGRVLVIAPEWPTETSGYGWALASTVRIFLPRVERLAYVGLATRSLPAGIERQFEGVEFSRIQVEDRSPALHFILSVLSGRPALARKFSSRRVVAQLTDLLTSTADEPPTLIVVEDVPLTVLLPVIRTVAPQCAVALRSHNVLIEAFAPFTKKGTPFHRLAWMYECRRIRALEQRAVQDVDHFWTITKHDANRYLSVYNIEADAVVGVAVETPALSHESGDLSTLVSLGTLDLRKADGMAWFVRHVWPDLRRADPARRLFVGGRGSVAFDDPSNGVMGVGFVSDQWTFFGKGRIFVNPQLIGSGINLKSLLAMMAGRALVTTPKGAEGIEGVDGRHFFVCNSASAMIEVIEMLTRSRDLVDAVAERGQAFARRSYDMAALLRESEKALGALTP